MGKIYNELKKANEEAQRLENRTKEALSTEGKFIEEKSLGGEDE